MKRASQGHSSPQTVSLTAPPARSPHEARLLSLPAHNSMEDLAIQYYTEHVQCGAYGPGFYAHFSCRCDAGRAGEIPTGNASHRNGRIGRKDYDHGTSR